LKYILQDMIVTAFGAIDSLMTTVILLIVENQYGFAFYSLMLWFFIPVGAIFSGFVAAGGYYVGARIFGQKPSSLILFNMVAVSIGTFFTIYYLSYIFIEIDGQQISDLISFNTYLDYILRHQSLSFSFRGHSVGSTGELGTLGYATAVLQILGFAIGGAVTFFYLSSLPYCEVCRRYLKKVGLQDRFTSESASLAEKIQDFALLLDKKQFNDAIRFHAEKMGVYASPGHHLRTRIITRVCKKCGINHLDFFASKLEEDSWTDISETKIGVFTNVILETVDHS